MARGVSRKPLQKLLVQPLNCQIEATNLKHSFLYMPFDPFEHERQVVRLEVLTQNLRNTKCPVSYFSKTSDIIIQGWSTYLSVIAAPRDLLQDAEDFTPEQPSRVHMSQYVLPPLEQKDGYWLTSGHLGGYQAILLDNPNVIQKAVSSLNSATLLPTPLGGPCLQAHV